MRDVRNRVPNDFCASSCNEAEGAYLKVRCEDMGLSVKCVLHWGRGSSMLRDRTSQRTPSMAACMAAISAPTSLPSEALPANRLAAERR